jgi:hypothetical protein
MAAEGVDKMALDISDIAALCRDAADRLRQIETEDPEAQAYIERIIRRLATPEMRHSTVD